MQEYESVRKDIHELIEKDFFGPYFGDEEILELGFDETPLKRYLTGVLFPRNCSFEKENDDGGFAESHEDKFDDFERELALSNSTSPSCFGFSFACEGGTKELLLSCKYGVYTKCKDEEEDKDRKNIWIRTSKSWHERVSLSTTIIDRKIDDGIGIRLNVRKNDKNGNIPITFSVVHIKKNEENSGAKNLSAIPRAENSFFQVHFSVSGIDGEIPFVDRKNMLSDSSDPESSSIDLLYRSSHSFASGHGCSVDWQEKEGGRADLIESSFIPRHLVYPISPTSKGNLPDFSLKSIVESSEIELKDMFKSLNQEYDRWIEQKQTEINILSDAQRKTARIHLDLCMESSNRIKKGIDLLVNDRLVFKAFILSQKAMLYQLAHSEWNSMGQGKKSFPSYSYDHKWRPFQIAFILQCLESIVNPDSDYRNIVDLLWFPTGGGKTEAYLGISAFVLFHRRLRGLHNNKDGGGTAILTRYTLRLLTLDQFLRAALLACSCEIVRNESDLELKNTAPISIGLWVGKGASPNYLKSAAKILRGIQKGGEPPLEEDPVKLRECPWCGSEISPADYEINERTGMLIKCPNQIKDFECPFVSGIPVWIIDEDIYRERPSLVVGTVDKFARLPWIKEAGHIFGSGSDHDPPELIIQDELHLISGPLGTMVGLYETAIELLCNQLGQKSPKIISSTATIRNSKMQINGIFGREVRQFPQPGIDYRDSFFSCEEKNKPGRLYLGVFAPSTSPTTALVRTFACLLHAAKNVESKDIYKDPYWTLISYFNSLRELGGARRHIEDDVTAYLKFCEERDNKEKDTKKPREIFHMDELTGRVNSSDLNEIRKRLHSKYPDQDYLDVVLATNMISVGLDVPRLGVMAMVGQPKTTTEYIQASSRIGRRYPGLVVNIFKWTNSRDRSHYERFKTYHKKLYSEVEATSVTPFSSRARDRGLHAVIIATIRHLVANMARNEDAKNFEPKNIQVEEIIRKIKERIRSIDISEFNESSTNIDKIVETWDLLTERCPELVYQGSEVCPLLKSIEKSEESDQSFPTLNSLRNIDQTVGLYLMRG
ncbi:helicase-related protein [Acidobacteriota bacterium]